MAEEIKEKIYEFLKEMEEDEINQRQISIKTKTSYPSVLKWIAVLIAEEWRKPRVKVKDYGNIKLVSVEGK